MNYMKQSPPTELGIAKLRGRPKKVHDLKYDVKPVKVSKRMADKRESRASNTAAWGPEPTWHDTPHKNKVDYANALGYALNYYSVMGTPEKLKKWTLEYLGTIKLPSDTFDKLSNIPDRLFNTIGSVSRMMLRGAKLSKTHVDYIVERAHQLVHDYGTKHKAEGIVLPERKQLDPLQRKLQAAIEEATDDYLETRKTAALANFDFPQAVRDCGANAAQVRGVIKAFAPRAQELQETLSGDAYLKEAYSNLSRPQLSMLHSFYTTILQEGIESAPKKARKPRTKKPQSAEKILRKFQHQHSCKELKIESISPKDILGADELWVFNTKTRKLGFFKAAENEKLSVKGTSMRNYDENASFCKKLRKPAEQLAQVGALSKPATKKYVATIRAKEQKLRSRINGETLLVRVF